MHGFFRYLCTSMKFLLYILSLHVLMLSFMPCTDEEDKASGKEQVSAVAGLQQQGQQDYHEDLCSPLCSCQCCHTHYQVYSLNISENLPLPEAKQNTLYTNNFSSSPSCSIWQPPKV